MFWGLLLLVKLLSHWLAHTTKFALKPIAARWQLLVLKPAPPSTSPAHFYSSPTTSSSFSSSPSPLYYANSGASLDPMPRERRSGGGLLLFLAIFLSLVVNAFFADLVCRDFAGTGNNYLCPCPACRNCISNGILSVLCALLHVPACAFLHPSCSSFDHVSPDFFQPLFSLCVPAHVQEQRPV